MRFKNVPPELTRKVKSRMKKTKDFILYELCKKVIRFCFLNSFFRLNTPKSKLSIFIVSNIQGVFLAVHILQKKITEHSCNYLLFLSVFKNISILVRYQNILIFLRGGFQSKMSKFHNFKTKMILKIVLIVAQKILNL